MIRIHPSLTLFQRGAIGAAAALALISLTPGEARALIINVGGQDYDVTTFQGSYIDPTLTPNFNTPTQGGVMPWWGDRTLTQEFRDKVEVAELAGVSGALGFPNGGNSPFFAYSADSVNVSMEYTFSGNIPPRGPYFNNIPIGAPYPVWAQAVAVPGPAPILGIPVVVAYCRKLKQRIKARRDASSVSSV